MSQMMPQNTIIPTFLAKKTIFYFAFLSPFGHTSTKTRTTLHPSHDKVGLNER